MLDRFAPHIHAAMSGKVTVIPDDLRDLLQEKMLAVLTTPGAAQMDVPDPQLLRRIMSVGMGEPVDDAFIPLLIEQSGLGPQADRSDRAARDLTPSDYKVVIIGAGITGLVAGIKLAEAGYGYEILEKNEEVGGTWLVGAASIGLISGPVNAQQAIADAPALNDNTDIIVTAQRRAERSQDVPVVVTAFTSEALQQQDIT